MSDTDFIRSQGGLKPMRILHIICSVDPAEGGPIEGVRQLGAVNSKAGHTIEIATLNAPPEGVLESFPLKVHCFGKSRGKFAYNSEIVPWLKAHSRNYDAIVVNGLWQYNSVAAWRACAASSTPYFIYPHGMLDPWFQHAYPAKHLKKLIYWKLLQHKVIEQSAALFFTCEEERRLAQNSFHPYKCKEVVVNYGTSSPPGDPVAQKALFFQKYPELKGKSLLLFISRIHPKKGCDLLIQAFAKMLAHPGAASLPPLQLVIAGPDQVGWVKTLKAIAEKCGVADRVHWPGMLTGDMKWGAFHATDAFILPSHQENFGIVVAEAAACGKPVLISNQVNIWREIEQDGAGIVEPDTLEGCGNLIQKWLELAPEERTRMGGNAKRSFIARFEIQQAARSMVAAIHDHLKATRVKPT